MKQSIKTKAVTTRKTKPQIAVYQPPPRRRTHEFDPSPGLDPQTRHVLVNLEQQVMQFQNLQSRIDELAAQVKDAEKQFSNVPEPWWHHLEFAITTLQKEFKDRIPVLERQYAAVELLLGRMDRLERQMELLTNANNPPK